MQHRDTFPIPTIMNFVAYKDALVFRNIWARCNSLLNGLFQRYTKKKRSSYQGMDTQKEKKWSAMFVLLKQRPGEIDFKTCCEFALRYDLHDSRSATKWLRLTPFGVTSASLHRSSETGLTPCNDFLRTWSWSLMLVLILHVSLLFCFTSVLEVYIQDKLVISERVYPTRADSIGVQLFAINCTVTFETIEAYEMQDSTWLKQRTDGLDDNQDIL